MRFESEIFFDRDDADSIAVEVRDDGPGFALTAASQQPVPTTRKLKIMMKSAWGSDDPTRASFPFAHGLVLAEAGHDVQIFLLAEATSLLRKSMVTAIFPVGWPPLSETLQKVADKHIPIFA